MTEHDPMTPPSLLRLKSNHLMLFLFIAGLFSSTRNIPATEPPTAPPRFVVIVNDYEKPEFARVLFATSYDDFGAVVAIGTGEKQSERVYKQKVKQVIPIPDLKIDFLDPSQFLEVERCLADLTSAVETYPQLRAQLLPLGAEMKTIVDSGAAGLVRRAGAWAKSEMQESGAPATLVLRELSGREYRNAEITGKEPDGLMVKHEGGVSKVLFVNLPKELQDKYEFDPIEAEKYRVARTTAVAPPAAPAMSPAEPVSSGPSDAEPGTSHLTSLADVAKFTLLAKMDEESRGTGFLVNDGGNTYIYTNMHNMDGKSRVVFEDSDGKVYSDVEYAEVAKKPWGFRAETKNGGDLVRFKLRETLPEALAISNSSEFQPGDPVGVVGNTAGEGMNLTEGKVTQFDGSVLYYDTPTWKGNSGSPVVDLNRFEVIGIHTWGGLAERPSPIDIVWKNRSKIKVGGGAGRAGSFAQKPEWERMTMAAFAEICQQQEDLIKLVRILGLMDMLEPKANGLYADEDQVIMGDYRIADVLEESKDNPLVQAILECDQGLRKNKESGIRTSNHDVYESYLPLLQGIYDVIANKRADTMRREQVFYFELELKESLVPHLCAFYEQSLLEAIAFYADGLSLGGTIPLSGRPRFPRLSNIDLMQALGVQSE